MKKLIILSIIALLFSGCKSMEERVEETIRIASKVGNVEYRRTGYLTDSDLTITVNEDGTRSAEYNGSIKTIGGPSIHLIIEDIPTPEDDD